MGCFFGWAIGCVVFGIVIIFSAKSGNIAGAIGGVGGFVLVLMGGAVLFWFYITDREKDDDYGIENGEE